MLWLLLSAFFIFSYTTVEAMVGDSTAITESMGILVQWFWILMALLCMAVGTISLKDK